MSKNNSKFSEMVKFHYQEDNEHSFESLVKCEILDSDVQKSVPSGDSCYRFHMLVQRGDKYGLFRIKDPVPSPSSDFSLISVENPFIFDDVLICDTRYLWTFVMVKQNDKWGVIETSIDYSLQLIIPIELNSSEEAIKALEKFVPNQQLFVYNPFLTYDRPYAPECIEHPSSSNQIIVFNQKAKGYSRSRTASVAVKSFGASISIGEGLTGQAYAIPTDSNNIKEISLHVSRFIDFAEKHPEYEFLVTKIGCGVAGYKISDIAPLFKRALNINNILLPEEFVNELSKTISCLRRLRNIS